MSQIAGVVSGLAGRYATAFFELADEAGALEAAAADVTALKEALAQSAELRASLSDPSVSRAEMRSVTAKLAERLGLNDLTGKFLGLMASKRRLAALPGALAAFEALAAERRGETTVELRSATEMSEAQRAALQKALEGALGGAVHIHATVDPELIGGLVVRMGSKMIDASIRSKLARMQTAMKEVRQ